MCYLFEIYSLWTGVFDLHSEIKFDSVLFQPHRRTVASEWRLFMTSGGAEFTTVRDTMHHWK
jgi:hypothetical protein